MSVHVMAFSIMAVFRYCFEVEQCKELPLPVWTGPEGVCTHTGKTGAGSESGFGYNVNKLVFSHAAGPAELSVRQISVPDWNSTSREPG